MSKSEFYANGYDAYVAGDMWSAMPYPKGTAAYDDWDRGFWAAHNEASKDADETGGIEQGYGDFYSSEFYDDEPNPYLGTYSEE